MPLKTLGHYQLVWWGFRMPRWPLFFRWPAPNWSLIYRWSIDLGCVELRRWVQPPKTTRWK